FNLDKMLKELELPRSYSITNMAFDHVDEHIETNCVNFVTSVAITNKTGELVMTVIRTNVECAVYSVIASNFNLSISNNIVVYKLKYRLEPERLLQRSEVVTKAYHALYDALESAKPFFSQN